MIMVPGVLKTTEVGAAPVVSGVIITYGIVKYRSKPVGFIGSVLAFYLMRFHSTVIPPVYHDPPRTFLIGGNGSYFAYVAVLWACLSAPVAVVYSLRETSALSTLFLAF